MPRMIMIIPALPFSHLFESGFVANGRLAEFCLLVEKTLEALSKRLKRVKVPPVEPKAAKACFLREKVRK